MKKIIAQFLICLMIWVVVEAQFVGTSGNLRCYVLQNTIKELKLLEGNSLDGNGIRGNGVILIVGDRVEQYERKTGFLTGTYYRKIDYKRK